MKNIKELFSMQEKRVSTLIICLLCLVGLAYYLYIARNDIPESLVSIIETLIYVIAGVNGANVISKVFEGRGKDEYYGD